MSGLTRALLAELGPEDLAELAERLAPYLRLPSATEDKWLDSKAAAEHLGISLHALHRLTSARTIPFSQERPGGRCYFRRSDLDAWRG
jgi:Helix-turn-helix domain